MAFWVGSYRGKGGKGLYALSAADGRVVVTEAEPRIANASFGIFSPRHGVTYFVEEEAARVAAWRYDEAWHPMTDLPSGGTAPCYLALSPDERWLACANYADGVVALFRLDPDNGDLVGLASCGAPGGAGPDPERQEGPHAHCVVFASDGGVLYHVDLGSDRVFRHRLEDGHIAASEVAFSAPAGFGPRHLLFHPDGVHALLICELSAQLLLLAIEADGSFACLDSVATIPQAGGGDNLGGHLAIDDQGRVLVTNRGRDSLVRFVIREARLEMLDWRPTGGASPRHFAQHQGGALVAHEESGSLTRVWWDRSEPSSVADIPGAAFVIDIPG